MPTAFIAAMDKALARQLGENGTEELTAGGVGDALVALFFKLTRGAPASDLRELVARARAEDGSAERLVDLVVLAFQTRATRGMGKGEKDIFYALLLILAEVDPKAVEAILSLVPHYGYFKDWFALLEAADKAKVTPSPTPSPSPTPTPSPTLPGARVQAGGVEDPLARSRPAPCR